MTQGQPALLSQEAPGGGTVTELKVKKEGAGEMTQLGKALAEAASKQVW